MAMAAESAQVAWWKEPTRDQWHAWVAAWCPTLGWIQVDPTNDLVPSDRHIVLAWGRDYDDVSPVKGVTLGGGSHTVEVTVEVTPVEIAEQ